jgi:hypothetical protein
VRLVLNDNRLLPFSTPLPPATLSITSLVVPFVMQTYVPTLQANVNKGWVTDLAADSSTGEWEPTVSVQQIVARAAIDSMIGDIPSVGPNASYTLDSQGRR